METIFNEFFDIRKNDNKEYEFYHVKTSANVCKLKNKKECLLKGIEIINTQGEENTITAIKILKDKKIKNKFFQRECIKRLFKNTFGKELHSFRCYLSFIISGEYCLDIIRLDKFLQVPEGISCSDYILNKYGSRAVKLVEVLI